MECERDTLTLCQGEHAFMLLMQVRHIYVMVKISMGLLVCVCGKAWVLNESDVIASESCVRAKLSSRLSSHPRAFVWHAACKI
jgi:hypothetical protein